MNHAIDREALLRRFLSYVRIWTTSDEGSESTPSSECQRDLARQLEGELRQLGLSDVRLDEHCYVYAVLPERVRPGSARAGKIPAIGLLAHLDVSPAVPGKDVRPIVHERYDGGELRLPGAPGVLLSPETDPALAGCVGLDIVTSDGTTLLGADDKAGIAVIMAVLQALIATPSIEHGPVHVAFTPDEEIGRGVAKFDLAGFGAEVAYTLDGSGLGELEDENFCADSMDVTFHGVNAHPGDAKGKMVNALKLAAELLSALPSDSDSPETTSDREGFVHPRLVQGNEESAELKFLIRDFSTEGLERRERELEQGARAVVDRHPGSSVEVRIGRGYRNMKAVLDQRPEAVAFAERAIRDVGLEPMRRPIRGGTDGARLSFMGLPTPNLFAGGRNFHSRREWVVVQHMEKSAEACLRLLELWAEHGEQKGRVRVSG